MSMLLGPMAAARAVAPRKKPGRGKKNKPAPQLTLNTYLECLPRDTSRAPVAISADFRPRFGVWS